MSLDHREVVGGGLVGLLRLHPVEERVGAGQRDGPDDRGGAAPRHGSPRPGALLRGDRCGLLLSQAVDPLVVSRATRGRSAGFGYLLKDRVLDPSTFLRQLEVVAAGATVTDPGVLPDAMRRSGRSTGSARAEPRLVGDAAFPGEALPVGCDGHRDVVHRQDAAAVRLLRDSLGGDRHPESVQTAIWP